MKDEQLREKPFYLGEEQIRWVRATLDGMTTRAKIGQLFCLMVGGAEPAQLDALFEVMEPGGVMLRPLPVEAAVSATRAIIDRSPIPPLFAANLEAGADGALVGGTRVGNEMQLAATDDERLVAKLAEVCAAETSPAGLNWAFAPILDIDANFRNPITNVRTFGSDPERVTRMSRAYVEELQRRGMAACIKHFPGDGQDERDQHLVCSVNGLSCEAWDASYGKAYRACIDAGALTVMAGHILLPAYTRRLRPELDDGQMLPATLAPELLQTLLRGKLGFNGLIVTDASTMGGFSTMLPRRDAVPAAIAAGADMFLFTKNTPEDYAYMAAGVENGVISHERLDDAVTRILALKAALGLPQRPRPDPEAARAAVHMPGYGQWAEMVADRSVTLVKEESGVLPISPAKTPRVLLCPIEQDASKSLFGSVPSIAEPMKALLETEGFEVRLFERDLGMEGLLAPCSDTLDRYDLILYVANLSTKSNQTVVRIEWEQPMGANLPIYTHQIPTIFVSFANPYHLLDVPRVKTYLNAYSAAPEVLRAVLNKLTGRSVFKGKSPVDAFCGKWDTRL